MTVSWNILPGDAWSELAEQQVDSIEHDIVNLVEDLLTEVESWMKREARWTDRTGQARAALYTDIERTVRQSVYLLMSHGPAIDYAWFLEANPKTALLGDTSDHFWPLLYRGVVEIVRRHSS